VTSNRVDTGHGAVVARDLMASPVISVPSTATVVETAQMMLNHRLGALPVTDASGALAGIVSDGDLLGRRPDNDRREWWLSLLARGAGALELPPQCLGRPVSEVMSTPVIAISPTTPVEVIAEMLQLHNLKRLPVLENGEPVGIVSRTDLAIRAKGAFRATTAAPQSGGLVEFLEGLIGGASLRGGVLADLARHEDRAENPPQATAGADFSAAALRARAQAFVAEHHELGEAERLTSQRERERQVKAFIDQHVSKEMWRTFLQHAEAAAANGEHELLMLRFPCELCSDGGRKIDVVEEGWEATLRGEAAEMFARWREELRPLGFRLSARIVSYERGGVLGDVGMYLVWGE
jgi:CBS domain-containing protein